MRNKLALPLLLSALGVAAPSFAGPMMKPGLWEFTTKSDMMKNMPKLAPEQMEQMRKMGIQMPDMSGDGMKTKVCLTKEMVDRDTPPDLNHKESGCQSKNFARSGNAYSLDIICDGPQIQGEGKVKGEMTSDHGFSSTYDFKGTAHGHPVSHHTESTGKWLDSDCGSVKPYDAGMKAGK